MNIKIVALGKIREKYIKLGVDEFLKRIQPYSALQIIEIPAETLYDEASVQKALEVEADKILKNISENSYAITLEVEGKKLSSEEFAEKINEISLSGQNQLVFVIGSAEGLHQKVKARSDFALSLSPMTFVHQMARLILAEQIYRAFKIIKNEPYHK